MFATNAIRFALFSLLSLSANAETLRGAQRELLNADSRTNPDVTNTSPDKVLIGTADEYAVLAKAGISSAGGSAITGGDIGVSPIAATAMTGFSLSSPLGLDGASGKSFSTSLQLNGSTGKAYAANYGGPAAVALTTAVSDMETAYTDAAGRSTTFQKLNLGQGLLGAPLNNDITSVLTTGVYTFDNSVTVNADITFHGTANDVFIIQIAGDLLVEQDVSVAGGALAENIFWQVSGEAVVKATKKMKGILLVKTAVTFETGSTLNGRVLTQTRCNLDATTINAVETNVVSV
jgi:hypothetical protein